MTTPLLTTKLYIPPVQPELVSRPRLIEQLSAGLQRKLVLISAPAGFGKTTLVSEWADGCERFEPKVCIAWLSLDEGDNDPVRLLAYLIAALQTVEANKNRPIFVFSHAPIFAGRLRVLRNSHITSPNAYLNHVDRPERFRNRQTKR